MATWPETVKAYLSRLFFSHQCQQCGKPAAAAWRNEAPGAKLKARGGNGSAGQQPGRRRKCQPSGWRHSQLSCILMPSAPRIRNQPGWQPKKWHSIKQLLAAGARHQARRRRRQRRRRGAGGDKTQWRWRRSAKSVSLRRRHQQSWRRHGIRQHRENKYNVASMAVEETRRKKRIGSAEIASQQSVLSVAKI